MGRMLVGRDAECAVLSRALAAAQGRRAPVVLVSGEGGAGKTTLVEHVLARTGTPVLSGRAAEWAGAAYDVLARALRPAVRDKAGPVPPVLAQIFPERGEPPAAPDPAALAAGVCSVLASLAGGRPLALFLDDLQWADQATLGLLPALAEATCDIPVTLVGCYRSDELPRDHRLRAVRAQLRRSRQLTEIDLGPLGDEDVVVMLTHLLGAKPGPALAAAVASRADGIPFAVEELALALRDGGGAAVVPDGVREAVLLRTARLSGEERTLLETAAVAGQEFDIDSVLAVCGLAAWPDGFTGAGLLTEVRDGRAAFRHSLTHEAAYADIPWSRRRGLHRELARSAGRQRRGTGPDRRASARGEGLRGGPRGPHRGGGRALCGARVPRRRPGAADGAGTLARGPGGRRPAGRRRPAGQVRGDVLGIRRGGDAAP